MCRLELDGLFTLQSTLFKLFCYLKFQNIKIDLMGLILLVITLQQGCWNVLCD